MTSYGGNCTDADPSRARSITAFAASVSSAEQVRSRSNGSPMRIDGVVVRHQHVTGSTSTFCAARLRQHTPAPSRHRTTSTRQLPMSFVAPPHRRTCRTSCTAPVAPRRTCRTSHPSHPVGTRVAPTRTRPSAGAAAAPPPIRAAPRRTRSGRTSSRSASSPACFAVWATRSCHSRTRSAIRASSRRDITRDRPLSTSNASIQPAETPGSSNANDASTIARNTSCTRVEVRELPDQALRRRRTGSRR